MELADFIAARLDEDEAMAKAAEDDERMWPLAPDPARVLREVAAKRAIVALHAIHSEPERWGDSHHDRTMRGQPTGHACYWCATCDYDRDYGHIGGREEGCPTIRAIAAIWSDHPDYRAGWAG